MYGRIALVLLLVLFWAACSAPNNSDHDEDGFPDRLEAEGEFYRGYPLYDLGARPNQTDVFVFAEYVGPDSSVSVFHEDMAFTATVFEKYGLNLHFDMGDLFHQAEGISPRDFDHSDTLHYVEDTAEDDLGRTEIAERYASGRYREENRDAVYHYALFHDGLGGSIAGSFASLSTPGVFMNTYNNTRARTYFNSSLIHEIGHMLGLGHGGAYHPDVVQPEMNFKPNYLSVMNYMYTSGEVPRNAEEFLYLYYYWQYRYHDYQGDPALRDQFYSYISDEEGNIRKPQSMLDSHNYAFSSGSGLPLDESDLNEYDCLPGYFACEVDWNGNGVIEASVEHDINRDGNISILRDYDDTAYLRSSFAPGAYAYTE